MGFQYVEGLLLSLIFYLLITRFCFAKQLRVKCKLSQRYYIYMLSYLDNVLILKNHQSIKQYTQWLHVTIRQHETRTKLSCI